MSAARYYRPSLTTSVAGVAVSLIVGLIGGFGLACAYSFVLNLPPGLNLKAFAVSAFAFAAGVGIVSRFAVSFGKIRSRRLSLVVGVAIGCLAIYFAWVTYLYALFLETDGRHVVLLDVKQVHAELNELGTADWHGMQEIVAAAVILTSAVTAVMSARGSVPFCKRCKRYCSEARCPVTFELPDDFEDLQSSLEAGDLSSLMNSAQTEPPKDACLQAIVYACPRCEETTWLKLDLVEITGADSGNFGTRSHTLIDCVSVPRGESERLLSPAHVAEEQSPVEKDLQ